MRYCSHLLSSAISSNEITSLSGEFRRITGGDMKLSGFITLRVRKFGLKIRVDVSVAIAVEQKNDKIHMAADDTVFIFNDFTVLNGFRLHPCR
jgi:hypothetical protein